MRPIVVTGGPCAGKTSAMEVLRERLAQEGIPSVLVPEAATDLILDGIAPWTCPSMLDFQTRVIALQLEREAPAFDGGDAVFICDRGICDSHAYLSDEDYGRALAANGLTDEAVLGRYEAIFLLESIATTDPDAYTKANNRARFEDAVAAAKNDERIVSAWSGHPCVRTFTNEQDFPTKAGKLADAVVELVRSKM